MNVKELKQLIEDAPDEMEVVIGWQLHSIESAQVQATRLNGRPVTNFQIMPDN